MENWIALGICDEDLAPVVQGPICGIDRSTSDRYWRDTRAITTSSIPTDAVSSPRRKGADADVVDVMDRELGLRAIPREQLQAVSFRLDKL